MHTIIRSQRRRILVLLALVAVFASGCIRVNLDIEVEEDGSGTVGGIVAINAEAIEDAFSDLGDLGEDLDGGGFSRDEICNDPSLTEGIDVDGLSSAEPYDEDGFCGTRFSQSFGPGEFDQNLDALDTEGLTLVQNGDNWEFRLPFDASEFDTSETAGVPGFDDIFDGAEYVVRVKLPGRQVEHNGDFIDDEGAVVWDIDVSNPPTELFLITEPGETITTGQSAAGVLGGGGSDDGGGFLKTLLIVLAVLAVLGLGAWFLISRNKAATPAVATGVGAFSQPGASGAPSSPPAGGPSWNPGASAAPPAAPGAQPSWSAPASPAAPVAPTPDAAGGDATQIIASPTPEQAMTPTWDPVRRTYVQWDATNNRWLVFDDATQAWSPEA